MCSKDYKMKDTLTAREFSQLFSERKYEEICAFELSPAQSNIIVTHLHNLDENNATLHGRRRKIAEFEHELKMEKLKRCPIFKHRANVCYGKRRNR